MVSIGDKVFVAPLYGQKDNLAVVTGPAGQTGGTGAAGGTVAYWSESVANLKYFSDMERSYTLTPPASTGYKCVCEEILQTVEITGLPYTVMIPPGFVSARWEIKTAFASGLYAYYLGIVVTLSTTKQAVGVLSSCQWYNDPGWLFYMTKLKYSDGSFACDDEEDGYETPAYQCNDAPNYSNTTFYLQAWVQSKSSWWSGGTPPSKTGYIRKIKAGATVYYDLTTVTLDTGTSTTVAETIITDTSKAWTPDEWIGKMAEISSGTAFGKQAQITDNDATTITCAGATFVTWGMANGNTFNIIG